MLVTGVARVRCAVLLQARHTARQRAGTACARLVLEGRRERVVQLEGRWRGVRGVVGVGGGERGQVAPRQHDRGALDVDADRAARLAHLRARARGQARRG